MKKKFKLIRDYKVLAFLPAKVGVKILLKKDRLINAYRYYRLKTGESLFNSKNIVDRLYRNNILNMK